MAKAAACKCKEVECEECPEWIFTFADLVMLMMGFFVILWVLKPAPGKEGTGDDDQKLIQVLAAMRDYFNFPLDNANPDKVDLHRLAKKIEELKPLKSPGMGGKTSTERMGPRGTDDQTTSIRPGKFVVRGGPVLFDRGQAAISPAARGRLDEIADDIRGRTNIILIKGHTALDDLPEGATGQQQMELSVRRAQAVADYLASKGVNAQTLRVLGCSIHEPVVQRVWTSERAVNSRVEVQSADMLVSDYQDRSRLTTRPATAPGD
jgi:flagellar motor protein MotB